MVKDEGPGSWAEGESLLSPYTLISPASKTPLVPPELGSDSTPFFSGLASLS